MYQNNAFMCLAFEKVITKCQMGKARDLKIRTGQKMTLLKSLVRLTIKTNAKVYGALR